MNHVKHTIYGIIMKEDGGVVCLLDPATTDVAEAQQLLQFRAEEWLDEQAEADTELEGAPRSYVLVVGDTKMFAAIYAEHDGQHAHKPSMTLEIQTTSVVI